MWRLIVKYRVLVGTKSKMQTYQYTIDTWENATEALIEFTKSTAKLEEFEMFISAEIQRRFV